jgi:hypothetical protein
MTAAKPPKMSDDEIRDIFVKFPPGVLDRARELLTRHSYSAHLPAHHARNFFGTISCSKTDILVLSGRDKTDNNGKTKIILDSILCGAATEDLRVGNASSSRTFVMVQEPSFVVTPLSSAPSFATVVTSSSERPVSTGIFQTDRDGNLTGRKQLSDVTAEVATWKHDGTPSPDTVFSWICTIEVNVQQSVDG